MFYIRALGCFESVCQTMVTDTVYINAKNATQRQKWKLDDKSGSTMTKDTM